MKKYASFLLLLALLAACSAPVGESPEPTAEPTTAIRTLAQRLSGLTGEEIKSIDVYGSTVEQDLEELARLLGESMANEVGRAAFVGDDWVWWGNIDLKGEPASIFYHVGLEEDLVELSLGDETRYVKDEGLYWYLRTAIDTPPDIDEEAYSRYKDFVEDYYDRDMEERNRRTEEQGDSWTTSGWELVYFQKAGEEPDLGIEVYQMRKVNMVDPPELAPHRIAGGAYVDSQLRIHGWDWKLTYLAVLDGEPAGVFYLSGELDMNQYTTRQEFLDMVAENTEAGG